MLTKKHAWLGLPVMGALLVALFAFLVFGFPWGQARTGHRDRTTDTNSSSLPDRQSKIAFLDRYLHLPSAVEATEFHVLYQDNSGGLLPAPSDYVIEAVLKVRPTDVNAWTDGLQRVQQADLSWGYALLPADPAWAVRSKPAIYRRGRTIVAVFSDEGIVFKQVIAW